MSELPSSEQNVEPRLPQMVAQRREQLRNEREAITSKQQACAQCGMVVTPNEYHPFAACLMFHAAGDGEVVRRNLTTVVEHGRSAHETTPVQATLENEELISQVIEEYGAPLSWRHPQRQILWRYRDLLKRRLNEAPLNAAEMSTVARMAAVAAQVQQEEPPAELPPAFKSLLDLEPNWDSYGAKRIQLACVQKAYEIWKQLAGTWLPVPHSDGTVGLEQHTGGFDIEIDVDLALPPLKASCSDDET